MVAFGRRHASAVVVVSLADVFDDLDEFVDPVAVLAGEADEVSGACDDGASLGCAGDRDAVASSELE